MWCLAVIISKAAEDGVVPRVTCLAVRHVGFPAGFDARKIAGLSWIRSRAADGHLYTASMTFAVCMSGASGRPYGEEGGIGELGGRRRGKWRVAAGLGVDYLVL